MKKDIKKRVILGALAAAMLMLAVLFCWPFIAKKHFLESIIKEALPESSQIVEYNIDYSFRFWRKTRVYAKIEIAEHEFEMWKATKYLVALNLDHLTEDAESDGYYFGQAYRGEISLEDVEEIFFTLALQTEFPAHPTIPSYLAHNIFIAIGGKTVVPGAF